MSIINIGYLKAILIWLIVVCIAPVTSIAQSDTTNHNYEFGFFGILSLETPFIDNSGLEDVLIRNGYLPSSVPNVSPGIGLQLYINRFIINFSINRNTKKIKEVSSRTDMPYRSTSFNIGYDLIRNPYISAYPYIGFKSAGLSYRNIGNTSDSLSVATYLQSSINYKKISNNRAHLDLGIGLSHQWFYLINFRFGYLLPLQKVKWYINDSEVMATDSPAISYKYYFTFTIGLGNIISNKYSKGPYKF